MDCHPQSITHMARIAQSVNQQDRDPSQWPRHPFLYAATGHMGIAASDPVRGRPPRPSPKTNQKNPLLVEM